ncbi:MAG TPA: hypothetical protein VFU31_29925, partial [Candidatus Binatia bacterium]|nr:hypothetical protein [Candidatus Binatia bacterium]
ASNGGADVEITLQAQTATGRFSRIRYSTGLYMTNNAGAIQTGAGLREAAQDTDAIRFLFESGNIASGNYAVYGLL